MVELTRKQLTSSLVPIMMLSGQRHLENAEAVIESKIIEKKPLTLGDLVGLLIDELIVDLCTLDKVDVELRIDE